MFFTGPILLPCYKVIDCIPRKPENAGKGKHPKPCNINKIYMVKVVLKREMHLYFGTKSKQFIIMSILKNAKVMKLANQTTMRQASFLSLRFVLSALAARPGMESLLPFCWGAKSHVLIPLGCCVCNVYSVVFQSISPLWTLSIKGILDSYLFPKPALMLPIFCKM